MAPLEGKMDTDMVLAGMGLFLLFDVIVLAIYGPYFLRLYREGTLTGDRE